MTSNPLTRRNFLRALAASVVAAGCTLPAGATKKTMSFVYDPAGEGAWILTHPDYTYVIHHHRSSIALAS